MDYTDSEDDSETSSVEDEFSAQQEDYQPLTDEQLSDGESLTPDGNELGLVMELMKDQFCRFDDDGLLHIKKEIECFDPHHKRMYSEALCIYNSEWRILIIFKNSWGHYGAYIECINRGSGSLHMNYACHVQLTVCKKNDDLLAERGFYHVFDGFGDYGFQQLGNTGMYDRDRVFKAKIEVFGRAPCGLVNLSTLCYMNALLQALYAVTEFRRLILKADVENEVVRKLQKLFIAMQFGSSPGDSASVFYATEWAKQENSFYQQDIEEFLTHFIAEIEDALKPAGMEVELQNLFRGFATSYTESTEYGYKSKTAAEFYVLQLNMLAPDNSVVTDMHATLKQYCRTQFLDGDNCVEVPDKGKQPYTHLPPVLNIYLMRSKWDQNRGLFKIYDKFHFPKELDMSEYVASEDDGTKDDYVYVLQSFVVHKGTGVGGHYTTYTLCNYLPTESKLWYLFDDKNVDFIPDTCLFKTDIPDTVGTPTFFIYIKKSLFQQLTSPSPQICNISASLAEELKSYIIKVIFLTNKNGIHQQDTNETELTTEDIFEFGQEWLFTQAANLYGLEIGKFHLWAFDQLNPVPFVLLCERKRKIAELPIYNNVIQLTINM